MRRSPAISFLVIALALLVSLPGRAADHADAPNNSFDRATDAADLYFFLDPNDNSQAVMILTVTGFIVPGENINFGFFDPNVRYVFKIENTGDARPDEFIDVRFAPRVPPAAQMATVTLPNGSTFSAPASIPSNSSPTSPVQTVTIDSASGIHFFAGQTDDPFFFDIPAFARFVGSVNAGSPNPAVFERGRDSFAGYNILSIALRVPVSMIRGSSGSEVGLSSATERRQHQTLLPGGFIEGRGRWVTVDRMANPAVNVALIPAPRKNAYNVASTIDDANLEFAQEIVGTLRSFGTSEANINILANVAVVRGDIVRLDTSIPNTGPGGGNNPGAGFPNGRRLQDDVIDIILTVVANNNPLGDNVNANERPFGNTFPFLAPAHQPRPPGTLDDQTRN